LGFQFATSINKTDGLIPIYATATLAMSLILYQTIPLALDTHSLSSNAADLQTILQGASMPLGGTIMSFSFHSAGLQLQVTKP
jgi:hypothetical protein